MPPALPVSQISIGRTDNANVSVGGCGGGCQCAVPAEVAVLRRQRSGGMWLELWPQRTFPAARDHKVVAG